MNFLFSCFEKSKHKYTDSEQLAYIKVLLNLSDLFYKQYDNMIEKIESDIMTK